MEHASLILTWQENLTKEEMPPEWMWSVTHELEIWFERLDDERREKYGPRQDDESSGPMMSNELSQHLRRTE